MKTKNQDRMKIGVFITCLVDMMRPEIGFATAHLLDEAGVDYTIPYTQTCCGQPAYNAGDRKNAKKVARQFIQDFKGYDIVIVPSGSCAGMLKHHLATLFDDETEKALANSISDKIYELSDYLHNILAAKAKCKYSLSKDNPVIAYHDSCSSFREMKTDNAPRALLQDTHQLNVRNLEKREVCCGFGGLFCVKYPDISNKMAGDKANDIIAKNPDYLLAGDLGCLLHISGKLSRMNQDISCYHYAEFLAFGDHYPALNHKRIP